MTMTRHQTTPAPGQRDMSMASLSRSSSGDSLVLEEKKSGDAVDAMMMTTDDLQGKQYLNKPFSLTGRKEFCHMISNGKGLE